MRKTVAIALLVLGLATATAAQGRTISVVGCRYGENRPAAPTYACLLNATNIQTDTGAIPLPEYVVNGHRLLDDPLYLRITQSGPLKLAGQSHGGLGNWEYAGGLWAVKGPSYGVNPVIYNAGGTLFEGAPQYGSQGLRFFALAPMPVCTGNAERTLCTGDNTYADPARRIGEWTELGNVTLGQSGFSCIAIYGGQRYVLDTGACVELHMTRAGSSLAISYYLQDQNRRVFRWLEESELPLFPAQPSTEPEPQPNPEPQPQPQPSPNCGQEGHVADWQKIMPNRIDMVQRFKDLFPAEWHAMNTAGDTTLIRRIAWALHQEDPRWGLNGKRGTPILSEDVIAFRNDTVQNAGRPGMEAADVIGHHGAPSAFPSWQDITCSTSQGGAGGLWIKPEPVDGGTVPDPQPDPGGDVDALKRRIAELESEVAASVMRAHQLEQERNDARRERDAAQTQANELQAEIDQLLARQCHVTGPGWVRSLFGIRCEVR